MALFTHWLTAEVGTPAIVLCGQASPSGHRVMVGLGAFASRRLSIDAIGLSRLVCCASRRAEAGARDGSGFWLDGVRSTVGYCGRETGLSRREFALAASLARNPGEPVPRIRLIRDAWFDYLPPGTAAQNLERCVCRLRTDLARLGLPSAIRTVRGVGYMLVLPAGIKAAAVRPSDALADH